ncbi:MAG: hypothetical protein IPF47_16420 [Gemmatimonadetes bacterium]|nr:hypothetical protein [Gemmatimonadota bacterium]
MIAAIGALSGGPAVGSETVDYVARIAELRRQLAAIQRKLAEAAKGGASELNTITQQSLAQQVVALQAHIAVLQLPHVSVPALPALLPASPPSSSQGAAQRRTRPVARLGRRGPDAPNLRTCVWGHVDREA